MRHISSFLLLASFVAAPVVFAADEVLPENTGSFTTQNEASTVAPMSSSTSDTSSESDSSGALTASGEAEPSFNAAPNPPLLISSNEGAPSNNLGEFKEVSCDAAAFKNNSCNQCFEGGAVEVGERLTGLFDNWNNTSSSVLTAYENEQILPKMHAVGQTTWVATPADESALWKTASDVTWTPSGDKKSFMLTAGQKIRFMESDLGAGYTLKDTTQKNGDLAGILQYPIVYHSIDMASGNEGAAVTHNECVSYTVKKAETPKTPDKPVVPAEVTTPPTGPTETLLLILAAFFIAFGLMFSLRKRV